MAVYACAKGTALKDCNTTNVKLLCEQKPLYGGTGNPLLNGTRFDEPGYVLFIIASLLVEVWCAGVRF